jgi:selenocysteine-specific elongation factor
VAVDELEALTGERRPAVVGDWIVDASVLRATQEELRAAIAAAGAGGLDVARLDERRRAVVSTLDGVVVDAGRARVAGVVPDDLSRHPFLAALEAAPFAPPPADGVDRAELRELIRRGLAVESDGVVFAASAVDAAARIVARLLAVQPDGIPVPPIRDALGSSRKHVLPLLTHLDATGVTRRRGDLRIAGPRLPSP